MVNLLLLCLGSFGLGSLPIIAFIFFCCTGRRLSRIGTGNISVSAAFYHGGTIIGVLAVISEALKGIGVVLVAQKIFPEHPAVALIALSALVLGRFILSKSAGTTNTVWGVVAYNWRIAFFLLLLSGGFYLFDRDRNRNKYLVLFLLPLIIAIMVQEVFQTIMAMILGGLLAMIYQLIPDDLELDGSGAKNQAMFLFLKGRMPQNSLDLPLKTQDVGGKAANLSYLKREGFNVPAGWVLKAGDDPEQFAAKFSPSKESPLAVRSSAVGEDTLQASAAGQYETILNVTSQRQLLRAIARCQDSFENANAIAYRHNHQLNDSTLSVLVQPQIQSVFAGVAFSRDPLESWLNQVVIEGVEGQGEQLVSGKKTPFRFTVSQPANQQPTEQNIRGQNPNIPKALVLELATLARKLEQTFDGIPQDIEWAYDGQQLWILQSRPITTLYPIWTRKIAAEVIPGLIPPLTWSINQPLTCGVWGNLFQAILGQKKSQSYTFSDTAEVHFGRAYFNASLLGNIFIDMGLPPESLEFLTRGASITPPKGLAIFQSVPGLTRLLRKELSLNQQFKKQRHTFHSFLGELEQTSAKALSPLEIRERVLDILAQLEQVTYFQIMAPLSFALRQKVFGGKDDQLDLSVLPEVSALRAIANLAEKIPNSVDGNPEAVLNYLEKEPEIQDQWQSFLQKYGYLSEVATDISIQTWQEEPKIVAQSIQNMRTSQPPQTKTKKKNSARTRLELKGEVAEIYNRLLAHLRWSFIALEQQWINQNIIQTPGDIFFLKWSEIQQAIETSKTSKLSKPLQKRKQNYKVLAQQSNIPPVIYGQPPETLPEDISNHDENEMLVLEGIGASSGEVEGEILIIQSMQEFPNQIDPDKILVVPFTDAGWAPIFGKVGGIISEVGGRLSHGAILAREYGIPAIMDVSQAPHRLKNGQKVRMNGLTGRIEILADEPNEPQPS